MHWMSWIGISAHGPPRPWATLGVIALFAAACADDTTTVTDTAQGTTTQTTDEPTSTTDEPPTTTVPTSTEPPTTSNTGTDSTTAVDPPTTTIEPTTTTETTTDTTTTTTTDTTDTTDTDSTTGDPVAGKSITQTVNSGTIASSPNFRMVFTLGQPTQNQGVYTSNNFRLQGGLIGANGNPP
ncbi:hypothetical protein [Nannocystis sp. SCPEA4]|uniref:hypothetical protein n=1 Tax=Nannocystis sp. SCPEA4 TaxID=2996787 RepID=UPI00226EE1EE|nr:hypothetical protein [Nannocystis sp. SCPEA4]MCY1054700.1 hypothetical protein [Nannocystis sp. SCPEA4]